MALPIVPQGTLNRLRTSVIFADNPSFNVTTPYMGRASVRLRPEGEITQMPATLTGTVTSPEPFQMLSVIMNLVRSLPLADQFKQRWESDATLGLCTVRTDTPTLSVFQIYNSAIAEWQEIDTKGDSPDLFVTIRGYYLINSSLYA